MGTTGKRWGTPPESRFWEKVDKKGPLLVPELGQCWEWTGCIKKGGYGYFFWSRGIHMSAHQASWKLGGQELPPGKCVLHRCDNRRCVRPTHLWLGTKTDNNADRDAKKRQRTPMGEDSGMAKLSESKVKEIRALHSLGHSCPAIALQFGVDRTLVWQIVTRRIWKHVD